jgi:hypothetical protein
MSTRTNNPKPRRAKAKAPAAPKAVETKQVTMFCYTGEELGKLQAFAMQEITKFWNRKRVQNGKAILMMCNQARPINVGVQVNPETKKEGGQQ